MKLYILFGQRKCSFPGEYTHEALEIIDEFGTDENPDWLSKKRQEYLDTGEFAAVEIVVVNLSSIENRKIEELLNWPLEVEGTVSTKDS